MRISDWSSDVCSSDLALKQVIDTAGADANPQWQQLLMAAYFDSDQAGEAAAIAEAQLAKNPDDKKLQMNMASIYLPSGQDDKAIALLAGMRATGQNGSAAWRERVGT